MIPRIISGPSGADESDVDVISRLASVPKMLRLICKNTGLGFAAVAKITDSDWIACAVQDNIALGVAPGFSLALESTLCYESAKTLEPVVVDQFSTDARYADNPIPNQYGIECYIAVPIVLSNGYHFGNLCGTDRKPVKVSDPSAIELFETFASFIALQLEQALAQSTTLGELDQERSTSALREEFIAILGHDLRNPLSAISTSGQILERFENPAVAKIGRRITTSTRRMAMLIDDVMDYARSRLGAGIGVAPVLLVDLDEKLREIIGELRTSYPDRVIRDDIVSLGPVTCDGPRVQQLLSNLLANALTHGAADSPVEVHVGLENTDLVVAVSNKGDVIAADTLAKVFEPYWRPESTPRGGGLGLGLFICKQIVNGHRGAMEVRSSLSEGTCFSARIPIAS